MVTKDEVVQQPSSADSVGGADSKLDEGLSGEMSAQCAENEASALAALQKKLDELNEQYLIALADSQNARKRAQEEVTKAHRYGLEKLADALLPVRDSLEMTLLQKENVDVNSLVQGVDLTLKQLTSVFDKCQIVEINPELGSRFDPAHHQAMSVLEGSEYAASTVAIVMQKGYVLADRVLRPALVAVAK